MEHSYTRDFRLLESSQTASTRTLMVHRPPQCPSCHTHPHDERIDLEESYNPPIPSYNEESARRAMQESENIVGGGRNSVSDEDDWEEKVNKFGWSVQQFKLFDRVARLLDMDRLARLTNTEKQHEPVHRRTVIDKSVSRLRQALASVSWETRLTQWLHSLLMENLPPCYLAIYIDILQTLHAKLPMLVNKMVFCNPHNIGPDLLGPVLKKPWEPIVAHKNRKLPGQPYIVVVPSVPQFSQPTARQQKWFSLFATMASVIPIQTPPIKGSIEKQTLQSLAENMVATTRTKIQQVRTGAPNRSIILVGFDAGAALAIQIGLVETVSCVICLGFSYNTYNGVRGAPDDHIVDITSPVMFVIGQNSARSSQEEIEMLRSRMLAQTSLVVVGSADECLRVSKTKRKIDGVTQSMVENMVADEIAEFATNCLLSPPRQKKTGLPEPASNGPLSSSNVLVPLNDVESSVPRKRKTTTDVRKSSVKQSRQSSSRTAPKPLESQQAQEALDIAIQSILPSTPEKQVVPSVKKTSPIIAATSEDRADQTIKYEMHASGAQIVSGLASTPIPLPALKRDTSQTTGNVNVKLISNQLIQLKPNTGTTQKFYSVKSTHKPVVSVIGNSGNVGSVSDNITFSPPKFTIVRGPESEQSVDDQQQHSSPIKSPGNDLSQTNIFDLPIVFADNEGDNEPPAPVASITVVGGSPTTAGTSAEPQVTTIQAPRLVTLQGASAGTSAVLGKSNKIVLVNKGSLKPVDGTVTFPYVSGTKLNLPLGTATSTGTVGTIVSSGSNTGVKYTKLLLTKPLTPATGTISSGVVKNLGELFSRGKVEFINSSGVKQTGTPVTMQQGKYQPIVISTTGGNNLSQTGVTAQPEGSIITTSTGGNKIVIKTSPASVSAGTLSTSLVGRNLTLKRFNIVSTSAPVKQSPATMEDGGDDK
ncbi:KAT8 regulatory NSL complex subunit 3 [Anopheles coustani]|uniref:KAT8 regulatory NSL complex subunit 3 n=1 Tax=Anopheles coustani TaxID=139045 RepID=UPI002657F41F|nr:KAT8 regulatory NSL complex subunit 3 [Anopheles coustani]XP_058129130.1 KAT8 regulatory NSL complex subunit 3 [Anopheles coustani]